MVLIICDGCGKELRESQVVTTRAFDLSTMHYCGNCVRSCLTHTPHYLDPKACATCGEDIQ